MWMCGFMFWKFIQVWSLTWPRGWNIFHNVKCMLRISVQHVGKLSCGELWVKTARACWRLTEAGLVVYRPLRRMRNCIWDVLNRLCLSRQQVRCRNCIFDSEKESLKKNEEWNWWVTYKYLNGNSFVAFLEWYYFYGRHPCPFIKCYNKKFW